LVYRELRRRNPFDRTNPVHGKGLFFGFDYLV
jgi:hypothetical protein